MFKKWLPVILAGILFLGGYQSIDSIDDIRSLFESTAGADEHSKPAGQQDGEYDVILEFPADRYPETAAHIQGAIKKGHSDVCTIHRDGAEENREESLRGIPTKEGYDRDEWPMAMCREGGVGAHVEYIDPADNRGAGSWVSHQTRDYPDGTRVKFVIKQPEGSLHQVFYGFLGHTLSMKMITTETAWPATRRAFFIGIIPNGETNFREVKTTAGQAVALNIASNV